MVSRHFSFGGEFVAQRSGTSLLIAESFSRTLDGIYHARPQYPAGAVGGGKPPTSEVVKQLTVVKPEAKKSAGS